MLFRRVVRLCWLASIAMAATPGVETDTDRDGLPDQFEQALLQKFAPRFHISHSDCDVAPAEFVPDESHPKVKARNGTVYGQAFRVRRANQTDAFLELHYFHLWSQDCGLNRHDLDTESVSALLRADSREAAPEAWRALYWHAAAHDGTLCDMGNGAAAAALRAEEQGPDVWVSSGKHASFLDRGLCAKGCGRDVCENTGVMPISKLVNIGETGAPMNGAVWSASPAWPLAAKMEARFTDSLLAQMPSGPDVTPVPSRRIRPGTRTTIKVAGRTYTSVREADAKAGTGVGAGEAGAEAGLQATGDSLSKSADQSGRALKAAGRFMKRAYRAVVPEEGSRK
jgi:hypothetical protein